MSLLTPLYIAGLLAVSLPILFHLIRRTPRGQMPFSSLMFLSPSPPRVTRRSRLDHILLLILRGLALSLLAFAFARPFLRDAASLEVFDQPGRRIAILIDRSASMRRGDLWQQALARAEQVLSGVTAADQVALLAFDNRVETLHDFAAWNQTPAPQRVPLARSKIQALAPTWGATELGEAITTAAELLTDASDSTQTGADLERQIVLISDLQQGSRLEALQAYSWPKGVTLDVHRIKPNSATNAAPQLATDADELNASSGDGPLRVRVVNEADSSQEQFTLGWATAAGEIASIEPLRAHVPPGASRVFRAGRPSAAAAADRLVLHGDDYDFDNTLYLAPPRQEEITVVYFGSDAADDTQGLRYYLERGLVDTPRRKIHLVAVPHDQSLDAKDAATMRLAVAAEPLPADRLDGLRRYVAAGGTLVVPLVDDAPALLQQLCDLPAPPIEEAPQTDSPSASAKSAAEQSAAKKAAEGRSAANSILTIEEAPRTDFALLGEIVYAHPLFLPFADPRFGDFTKIHFWKHRRVRLPDAPGWNVLARFDNGDPAVIERIVDAGNVIVLTSSWRPADSQLALSSKFVPLLSALLERRGPTDSQQTQFTVGDASLRPKADARRPLAAEAPQPDRPGVYEVAGRPLAVNLAADESRTAPLGIDELEQRGARLSTAALRRADVERRRQLQVAELENRQKLWQWLIVAVLGFVIAETALAGHLTRKVRQVTP